MTEKDMKRTYLKAGQEINFSHIEKLARLEYQLKLVEGSKDEDFEKSVKEKDHIRLAFEYIRRFY